MKMIGLLGICIIILFIGCSKFDKKFIECVNQKSKICFDESNCEVGTDINDLKIQCCSEFERVSVLNIEGQFVSCMDIT